MPIERTTVQTEILNFAGKFDKVPVIYTDEFKETSVYDLAYSSSTGEYLDYLFIGYFTGENFGKWFFANARRHEEMGKAIEQGLGKKLEYVFGQAWFNPTLKMNNKGLKFDQIALTSKLSNDAPNREKILKLLLSQINPDSLGERLEIYATENKGFRKLWSYNYDITSQSLKPNKVRKE